MPQFVAISDERVRHFTPVSIRLVDAFTSGIPIGKTRLELQLEVAPDDWQSVDSKSSLGGNGVYSYPGLGRSADVARPPRNYRVLVDSDYYERYIPSVAEEFPVHFYNDAHPLAPHQYAHGVRIVNLQPNSNYPYPTHVPRVMGRVTRGKGSEAPFAGAEIRHQSLEVKSNLAGEFTMPVRIPAQDSYTTDVSDFNAIQVQNARGYAKAVLGVNGEKYRVFELTWEQPTEPSNYEATLTLDPLPGSDDLPAGLPSQTQVTVISFALLIDIPPYAATELDQVFDVQPQFGFQTFHSVVIPSTP